MLKAYKSEIGDFGGDVVAGGGHDRRERPNAVSERRHNRYLVERPGLDAVSTSAGGIVAAAERNVGVRGVIEGTIQRAEWPELSVECKEATDVAAEISVVRLSERGPHLIARHHASQRPCPLDRERLVGDSNNADISHGT